MSLLPVGFGSAADDDYEITDSLRFRSASDAYLSRTFSTPTNNKKWSYSVWMKRGTLSTNQAIISANVDGANYWDMRFNTSDQIFIQNRVNSASPLVANTTAVYRDSSAWYHITFVFDSDNSTASHRNRLYINGVEQTLSANSGSGNASSWNVNAVQHNIGVSRTFNSSGAIWTEYDGYQTEANFIDGQALAPTDFGEYDANGTWKAKKYTGTYGTNGFYLPMKPTTQAELQNTVLYTGTGASQSIDGCGYAPDLVWTKSRNHGQNHELYDSVRGPQKYLLVDTTVAEGTVPNGLSSFDTDGFSVGNSSGSAVNISGQSLVAWTWDAGDNQPTTGISSVVYSSAGVAQSIKGFGFNPDLVWIKRRNAANNNQLFDSVRGSQVLVTNETGAESNYSAYFKFTENSDGFDLPAASVNMNASGGTYVAWGWDAGDGDPVTNTTGSINSTVKANDAIGFSIVSYTGNATAGATVGHGLSAAPEMIITKNRSATSEWTTFVQAANSGNGQLGNLRLNRTNAWEDSAIMWNDTSPTSTVFSLGSYSHVNGNGNNLIAYCFRSVTGVSKIDSYTGTGATGKVITTGFRPGFVMIKATSIASQSWHIYDGSRNPFNPVTLRLHTNSSAAEDAVRPLGDFTDTGFTINSTQAQLNQNGATYIYMAFKGSYSDHVSPLNDTGSIDSRVKANPSKGFSIVTYTGDGGADTIGHGLSVAPKFIITKTRSIVNAWNCYHASLGAGAKIFLSGTNASTASSTVWNNTSPTSTVFSVGDANTNGSGTTMVAYCFSEVAGYSKIDSYTGTGVAGLSVTTGFRPAFVMTKRTNSTSNWNISDSRRSPTGTANTTALRANTTDTENTVGTAYVKFTDTGFEITGTSTETNANGGTYIYMAFADTADAVFNFDASGNKNNWLPNNINSNAESETTYDLMKDTPSLVDENAANFCTMNALNGIGTISDGNMTLLSTVANWQSRGGTVAVSSGKWYWEAHVITKGTYMQIGIVGSDVFFQSTDDIQEWPTGYGYYSVGKKVHNAANSSYGTTFTTGDLIGVALDLDAGTIEFYKNNASQGVAFTGISGEFIPAFAVYGGSSKVTANFGQRPFAYTPPTGFLKLNTFNLPDSTIEKGSDYFTPVLYNGNGGTQSITGVNFQPDWTWIKSRNDAQYHVLQNSVTGAGKTLFSNTTTAETGNAGDFISSFDSDGFTVNNTYAGGTNNTVNGSGKTYVGWNWKANGTSVSNTVGSITSTVSANTTAGFSIVTYTGNGVAGATVGHGLGVAPSMVIVKQRSTTTSWAVYHSGLTSAAYVINLNLTSSESGPNTVFWNSTAPTSTVFSLGTGTDANASGATAVAYCFAEVPGYSSFGKYTGNGSTDGPFIYTGFTPRWILAKVASSQLNATSWQIYDTARNPNNAIPTYLFADSANAESDSAASYFNVDIVSNGFKLRAINTYGMNQSGAVYIYMAFAENPFKNSNAR